MLQGFVPPSLVGAAQNDVSVKFSELLEMRRVIEQMADDIQAAGPDDHGPRGSGQPSIERETGRAAATSADYISRTTKGRTVLRYSLEKIGSEKFSTDQITHFPLYSAPRATCPRLHPDYDLSISGARRNSPMTPLIIGDRKLLPVVRFRVP